MVALKKTHIILMLVFLLMGCDEEANSYDPVLRLIPDNLSIGLEQEGVLTLNIEDLGKSIFGINIHIIFDPEIISFLDSSGFVPGDFFGTEKITFVREESATIHLTITLKQGSSEVQGSGEIGTLTFTGQALGTSSVDIIPSEIHFYDSDGELINIENLTTGAATINIQ